MTTVGHRTLQALYMSVVLISGSTYSQNITVDTEEPLEITLPIWKASDIRIRDPFILVEPETGTYILYAQKGNRLGAEIKTPGVEAYLSRDLETWRGPVEVMELPSSYWAQKMVWAPEVHAYQGNYYLFVTLTSEDTLTSKSLGPTQIPQNKRGTQVFSSDSPLGPFVDFEDRPCTPLDWMSLDGTLFIEDQTPYMIFCHEWAQVHDGTMELMELKKNLSGPAGDPVTLFKASDANWVRNMADLGYGQDGYVTDGPFFYHTSENKLLMIWSSFGDHEYAIGLAESESGKIRGPWKHMDKPLNSMDGGHGMIFNSLEGKPMIVFHQPNKSPLERMVFYVLQETDGLIRLRP